MADFFIYLVLLKSPAASLSFLKKRRMEKIMIHGVKLTVQSFFQILLSHKSKLHFLILNI